MWSHHSRLKHCPSISVSRSWKFSIDECSAPAPYLTSLNLLRGMSKRDSCFSLTSTGIVKSYDHHRSHPLLYPFHFAGCCWTPVWSFWIAFSAILGQNLSFRAWKNMVAYRSNIESLTLVSCRALQRISLFVNLHLRSYCSHLLTYFGFPLFLLQLERHQARIDA